MVYRKPEKKEEKLIEVFDTKIGKNIFISKKKLREMTDDPKFTDQDRYEVSKRYKGGLMVAPKRAKRGY